MAKEPQEKFYDKSTEEKVTSPSSETLEKKGFSKPDIINNSLGETVQHQAAAMRKRQQSPQIVILGKSHVEKVVNELEKSFTDEEKKNYQGGFGMPYQGLKVIPAADAVPADFIFVA